MPNQELHVRVYHEDGSMWATVDEFPGVFAAGDDIEELRASLAEGLALVLERPDGVMPMVKLGEFTPQQTAQDFTPQPVEHLATTELVCA